MEKVNGVTISGKVSEVHKGYVILKWRRHNGQENLVRVWDFGDEIREGDKVTVLGELDSRRIAPNSPKKILGVKATYVNAGERGIDYVNFTGTIFAKGEKRRNFKGDTIVNLIIKVNDSFCATCVAWNAVAYEVEDFKVGDKVCVKGLILSREYKKNKNGIICPMLTTEVSITYINRIE